MSRSAVILTLAFILAGCPASAPAPATPTGFQATLAYRVRVNRALQRQLLSLAAALHQMLSHPVRVATVEVVERGIWVTPRDAQVRDALHPALVEAVGAAYLVRRTAGNNLMISRTRAGHRRSAAALVAATAAAVKERLAAAAPGSQVQTPGARRIVVHIKKRSLLRAARQVLSQRGMLTLHLVERGPKPYRGRRPFHLMAVGGHTLQRQPALSGDLVQGAQLQRRKGGATSLTLEFANAGAARFQEMAAAYGGTPLAILLDGKVLAAPKLKDPPDDGGQMLKVKLPRKLSEARVERLSAVLESAVLSGPLPAEIVERR